MNDNSEYSLIGNFDLKDAKSICDLLDQKQIDFEVEIDDQPIKKMLPWQAAYGGTYGSGASVNIYVKTTSLEECETILKEK
jgi:hypothetical protein